MNEKLNDENNAGDSASGPELVSYNRFGDWTAWSGAIVLLILLAVTLICLFPFVWFVARLLPGNMILWYILYFVPLVLMFIPGFLWLQVWIIAKGTRKFTPAEEAHYSDAWNQVVVKLATNHKKRRHVLGVMDADQINAAAAGGNVVLVTRWALGLPDRELQAVLAHELGHHTGLHSAVLIVKSWAIRPIAWVDYVAVKLHNTAARLSRVKMNLVLLLLLWLAALALRALSYLLFAIVWLINLVLLAFGRRAEYQADAFAARLGYAQDLINVFHIMEGVEQAEGMGPHVQGGSITDTHPPTFMRIERLRAHVEQHEDDGSNS